VRFIDQLTAPGPTRAKRALGGFALVGLVASLLVHLSTFLGAPHAPTMNSPIVVLHIAIFLPIGAMILALRSETKGKDPQEVKRLLLSGVPTWAKALLVVAFVYTPLNFLGTMQRTGGRSAEARGGEWVLTSHGRVVRHVTPEEAAENEALVTRGFSGHWMAFYLVPALFFLARRQPAAAGERRTTLVR
jgi:hypothetical protein